MSGVGAFLKKKDIEFSVKRYAQDAFSAMATGLFASLVIGVIIKTLGQQLVALGGLSEKNTIVVFLILAGTKAMEMMGPAMGAAVAWGLKAPPLVMFASTVTGYMGAELGGPAGAFVAIAIGVEFGKMVSKETKVDILVTPATTLIMGAIGAKLVGPLVGALMTGLGSLIETATNWQPLLFGIIVATIVGLALTGPISSAALCIALGIGGLAAGAATVGGCAQMVGFAVIGFKDNGIGGVFAHGIGTAKLQLPNVVQHPWILIPPTLTGAILGALSTCVFKMENSDIGAGMGTSGFVGQIGTFTEMGFSGEVLIKVLILHIILPGVLAYIFYKILYKAGKIKDGHMKIQV